VWQIAHSSDCIWPSRKGILCENISDEGEKMRNNFLLFNVIKPFLLPSLKNAPAGGEYHEN
jgi:hypothetical protein